MNKKYQVHDSGWKKNIPYLNCGLLYNLGIKAQYDYSQLDRYTHAHYFLRLTYSWWTGGTIELQ